MVPISIVWYRESWAMQLKYTFETNQEGIITSYRPTHHHGHTNYNNNIYIMHKIKPSKDCLTNMPHKLHTHLPYTSWLTNHNGVVKKPLLMFNLPSAPIILVMVLPTYGLWKIIYIVRDREPILSSTDNLYANMYCNRFVLDSYPNNWVIILIKHIYTRYGTGRKLWDR